MARAGQKTVRFTQVVERSGQPHVHTLWMAPEKDAELQRAVAAHRVLTIGRGAAGGNTDVGVVGFDRARQGDAQFLIFPKSLQRFDGAKVVGVKFDLVEQPAATTARSPTQFGARRKSPAMKGSAHGASRAHEPAKPARAAPPAKHPPIERPKAAPAHEDKARHATPPGDGALVREVRAALKELERGKSVAAFQRLQKAIADR